MSGFYWYPSTSEVPSGSIQAGEEKDGDAILVGRAFYNGRVIPGKIIANKTVAYVAAHGKEYGKTEWEVLSRGSKAVAWEEAADGFVPKDAVFAGTTLTGEKLYVGRIRYDGILIPGNINPALGVCSVPYDGLEVTSTTYEALILIDFKLKPNKN